MLIALTLPLPDTATAVSHPAEGLDSQHGRGKGQKGTMCPFADKATQSQVCLFVFFLSDPWH